MALVHRVNINFGFILNTLYCKCIVNIKRCKTEYKTKKQADFKYGENLTFKEMLNFRQMQARKSILVRVAENNIDDLKNFCTRYVNINKMFCYNTVNNKIIYQYICYTIWIFC
uniref:PAP associated domain containing 1 n=1 Tax=Apis cerana TaxID=7461 RepID=V9ID29_APICE